MDKLTKEQRHGCMSAIKSKNTKPELLVRKFLFGRGFRYRLNHPRLPGHPDLVLRKYKTVIFVNGCFWHGHSDCSHFRLPHTNLKFWRDKIERNRNRDAINADRLSHMGWWVITIWECQLEPKNRQATLVNLSRQLSSIYLHICGAKTSYDTSQSDAEQLLAAEQPVAYGKGSDK